MTIAFIGAGKMGSSLGHLFSSHQQKVLGYYDLNRDTALFAAKTTHSICFENLSDLATRADYIFITTPDDQIAATCQQLVSIGIAPTCFVGHTSGVLTSDSLLAASENGNPTASVHPLQAVTGGKPGADNLQRAVFTIEGNSLGTTLIHKLLLQCNLTIHQLDKAAKVYYHASACVASNYLVTLMDYALDLMQLAGFTPQDGYAALTPLIEGTLENIRQNGPANALTGPIRRGDAQSIALHLQAIDQAELKSKQLYKQLGAATLTMLKNQGITTNPLLHQKLEG